MKPAHLAFPHPDSVRPLCMLLAASSLVAGVIHAVVVPEHLGEWWVFGAFFVITAALQLAWAALVILRPSAISYLVGALASVALVAIWLASRTLGVPVGPEAWMPEPFGTADVAATVLELLIVIGSMMLFRRHAHGKVSSLH